MVRKLIVVQLLVIAAFILASCTTTSNSTPDPTSVIETTLTPNDHKNTKVTAEPGDVTLSFNSTYPKFSFDDLINESQAIIIGTVVDILPAIQADDPSRPGEKTIYTNVIMEVSQYLSGDSQEKRIALWVRGGKVGNQVVIDYDEPVYTVGDNLLLFLRHVRPEYSQPDTIQSASYFRVFAAQQGHYTYFQDNTFSSWDGNPLNISDITDKLNTTPLQP